MPHSIALALLLCLLSLGASLQAQTAALINDPDGYVNVRAQPKSNAAIVATVVEGVPFTFESREPAEWWKVRLPSGQEGWMHSSRIRFYFTKKDLLEGLDDPSSELHAIARGGGFDYRKLALAVVEGEPAACRQFFGLQTDGAGAELHSAAIVAAIHLMGDARLAAYLRSASNEDLVAARAAIVEELGVYPFEPADYLRTRFPKSAALLLKK